jgi:hypothetical protein
MSVYAQRVHARGDSERPTHLRGSTTAFAAQPQQGLAKTTRMRVVLTASTDAFDANDAFGAFDAFDASV